VPAHELIEAAVASPEIRFAYATKMPARLVKKREGSARNEE
jgi:hypothetical protein